jgi:hypothetical protein
MREQFNLQLDPILLSQLLNGNLTITDFFQQLFGERNSPNYRAMCGGLVAYHNKDGGSPEVTVFDLVEAAFNADACSGSFKCRFGIHFHYTCSDVHNDAKDTIRWDFKLNVAENTIHFTGEELWVRDAD